MGLAVLDALVETFGPFLIPTVIFAAGLVGYGVLLLLARRGVLARRPGPKS